MVVQSQCGIEFPPKINFEYALIYYFLRLFSFSYLFYYTWIVISDIFFSEFSVNGFYNPLFDFILFFLFFLKIVLMYFILRFPFSLANYLVQVYTLFCFFVQSMFNLFFCTCFFNTLVVSMYRLFIKKNCQLSMRKKVWRLADVYEY